MKTALGQVISTAQELSLLCNSRSKKETSGIMAVRTGKDVVPTKKVINQVKGELDRAFAAAFTRT